jgi:23S rRNA (guanine2445-N2)-methyltransferase / 23S rRNA (guanine2069-N7)-methyltransferase
MADFFVTTPKGCEPLLLDELQQMGIAGASLGVGGVSFRGELEVAYRACLWSRVGNRVLMSLARFKALSPEALYAGVQRLDWSEHLDSSGTLAVDCFVRSSAITHSHYAALKVKDAVVDQFRERVGQRPSVDLANPDVRLNLYLFRNQARLALDLSGDSLHRRGYREDGGPAPLKENLAAAILLHARWPASAASGGALIDPMCGSGTLPIEAALIAADIAPGSLGRHFGFERWLGHVPALWRRLLDEAQARKQQGLARLPPIFGFDQDARAVRVARKNLQRAGLAGKLLIEPCELARIETPAATPPGLLVVNPPYGERLGEGEPLSLLYRQLGDVFKQHFEGWRAALFTGNATLVRALRLRHEQRYDLYNGALPCQLYLYQIAPEQFVEQRGKGAATAKVSPWASASGSLHALEAQSDGARMLQNRLRKNLRHLERWARRNAVTCYRVYDADLPEYAVAIDLYQAEQRWAVVQEYAAPIEVEPALARTRLQEALGAVQEVLEIPAQYVELKTRRRQRGAEQYEKLGQGARLHKVEEGGSAFWVNFSDYLDTGLFLDHRLTRGMIRQAAKDQDFLNLFAYTGTASVQAAAGGARSTTTVDMSHGYLDWARRNLELNGFASPNHQLIAADCLEWLRAQTAKRPLEKRYGLIFLDPPTFSNSKRMTAAFDVQRDHVSLIRQAARLLAPGGELLFSNNYRRFRLDREALTGLEVADISAATLPEDFRRNAKIHRCWRICWAARPAAEKASPWRQ